MTTHTDTRPTQSQTSNDPTFENFLTTDAVELPMFGVAADGSLTFANTAMCRLLGYDNPEDLTASQHTLGTELALDMQILSEWAGRPARNWIIGGVRRWFSDRNGLPFEATVHGRLQVDRDGRPLFLQCAVMDCHTAEPKAS